MMNLNSKFNIRSNNREYELDAQLVHFSTYSCFDFDHSESEIKLLGIISNKLLKNKEICAIGDKNFYNYISQYELSFTHINFVTLDNFKKKSNAYQYVFICELTAFEKFRLASLIPNKVKSITVDDLLLDGDKSLLPAKSWVSIEKNIYPIDLPELTFTKNKDILLVDCPSRNLSMMPNGLGYIHNAIKKTKINFETVDLDIHAYHRYHIHRIFDLGGEIILPNGTVAPTDPWLAENYDFWTLNSEHSTVRESPPELLELFEPFVKEVSEKIIKAKPKVLGLSIQQCNEGISRKLLSLIKKQLPKLIVISGGYSCYNPDIGLRAFPEVDYMFIGEAELTIGPVLKKILNGERPINQAGVISKFDDPDIDFIPGPMPHNLDNIEFPKYEWFDNLDIYTNYNGYQLTPIIASRGCRWSRCTFCAERFYWRIRSAENFVDELEWFVSMGCYLFMFNESDLNGMPEKVIEICDEIIKRGLHKKVKLTGQLRIHKKSTKEFYEKLSAANFVALRFGVDAFSENTLKLQKKGYTVEMLSRNLKDCWESGIFTEVNWVIGIPGETDQDIDEGIELIIKNKDYIGRLSNINPLILVNGGVYWLDPEAHNIHFRKEKKELYEKYPRGIPASLWYSEKPYIDGSIRKKRFEKIVSSLYEANVVIGDWAEKIISDIKENKDSMRDDANEPKKITSLLDLEKNKNIHKNKRIIEIFHTKKITDKAPKNELLYYGKEGNYEILFYQNWFYAVVAGENIENIEKNKILDLLQNKNTLRAIDYDSLLRLIDDISLWANSRGNIYTNSRELQKNNETYYKAGSFSGMKSNLQKLDFKLDIINFDNNYYAVPNNFKLRSKKNIVLKKDKEKIIINSDQVIIPGNSIIRKFLRKLPRYLQLRIKETVRHININYSNNDSKIILDIFNFPVSYFKKIISLNKDKKQTRDMKYQDFIITGVIDKNASPEFLWSTNKYNFVKYDLMFYMLPHGVRINWDSGTVDLVDGVIMASSLKKLSDKFYSIYGQYEYKNIVDTNKSINNKSSGPFQKSTKKPIVIKELQGYEIVSYEGWVYGIPKKLTKHKIEDLDLLSKDIIRDVSEDVVEDQIREII